MPGTILGARDIAVNQVVKNPCSPGVTFPVVEVDSSQVR